jgi:hypothetical protein
MKHLFTGQEATQSDTDSKEELYFLWYLQELKDQGFIKAFKRSKTYTLSNTVSKRFIQPMKKVEDKIKMQTVLREHAYTPDYTIWWEVESVGVLCTDLEDVFDRHKTKFICQREGDQYYSTIEVKGTYDQNNNARITGISMKWLMSKLGIFVTLVKVPTIFEQTFTPERYLLTDKTLKPRRLKYDPKTISEYVDTL